MKTGISRYLKGRDPSSKEVLMHKLLKEAPQFLNLKFRGLLYITDFYHRFISPHMWQDMNLYDFFTRIYFPNTEPIIHIQLGGDLKCDKNPVTYSISLNIIIGQVKYFTVA